MKTCDLHLLVEKACAKYDKATNLILADLLILKEFDEVARQIQTYHPIKLYGVLQSLKGLLFRKRNREDCAHISLLQWLTGESKWMLAKDVKVGDILEASSFLVTRTEIVENNTINLFGKEFDGKRSCIVYDIETNIRVMTIE